jgi:hypothetical protein
MTTMKRILTLALSAALLGVAVLGVESACNNVGDCPSPSNIKPGGSCSGDYLTCPYTLQTPNQACDGTAVEGGLETSCTCTKGTWICPDPVTCEAGGSGDGGGDGEVDGTTDGQSGEGSTEDGGGDGAGDSASNVETGSGDATSDGSDDGAIESSAEGAADVTGQ